ncbi:MAG: phytanoyl-CoA dioxygenase family protein, partial [Bauldia litoralis]
MTDPSYALTGAQVATFQADGAACLRAVFDAGEIAEIQAAVDEAMAHPGPHALDFSGNDEGRFFGDVFVWTRIPALREKVVNSHLGEIAAKLMDAREVRFFFDHLLVKEPGSSAPTPWHQDAPYFPIEGSQCCSIWIALDPVTIENGAVEYVKGSHVPEQCYAPKSFHGDDRIGNAALA